MVPLNVTHTAIVTKVVHSRILSRGDASLDPYLTQTPKPSILRHMISTLVNSYAVHYALVDGPPIHDPVTIAYVSRPSLFTSTRYRVDVELSGTHTSGETVVDFWNYRPCDDSWGHRGRNCLVANSVNVTTLVTMTRLSAHVETQVESFFDLLLECIERCDISSPLNAVRY
jgi:uridine nucleosidase